MPDEVPTPGVRRRDFLRTGLAASGGAVLLGAGTTAPAAAATRATATGTARAVRLARTNEAGGFYTPNRFPLRPTSFHRLPAGSVRPAGWLQGQLDRQREGLNGRMPEVSDYLVYAKNGWVHPEKWAWEEMPYWLRGFGDLGYVTGDERILAETSRWIDGILATQRPDGWFGPEELRTSLAGGPDLWPAMPLLDALRSFHEYTGDERIIPFLTAYFRFQSKQPIEVFGRSWGAFRWGDSIASAYWLYNRTGEGWLLDLVAKMHEGSADYTSGIPTWHNVNLAQGFREPLEYWLLAGEQKFRTATYRNYDTVMARYGQFPGGGFAGDENCRPGYDDPRQGFETCGIAEFMRSFEMLTRWTGDPVWADRCEELVFNSLPAAFDPEQKGTHYISSANSIQLDNSAAWPEFQNNFAMQAYMPGVHQYRCCPHNYGMAWPYYVEELWLATSDHGLCASMYAPSEVRATVGDGSVITITEDTTYPFDETVTMRLRADRAVTFPFYLRVPGWCEDATVRVNGERVPVRADPLSYLVIERTWVDGDVISLRLPMRTHVRTWESNHDSVSVNHGPLAFSLAVNERWERFAGTDRWPEYEVFGESAWNYGLELGGDAGAARSIDVVRDGMKAGANPFTPQGTPITLRVRGRKIGNWQATENNVARFLQDGPVNSDSAVESLKLIPMGAARLRVTSFPRVVAGGKGNEWILPSASHVYDGDLVDALCDGMRPSSSYDLDMPRFTWWDRKGSTEWVQYDYRKPMLVRAVAVYWFDDRGHGGCRIPESWRLLYRDGDGWKPVRGPAEYGVERDKFNHVRFAPVETTGLRLEADLRPGFSGGILEWTVEADERLGG